MDYSSANREKLQHIRRQQSALGSEQEPAPMLAAAVEEPESMLEEYFRILKRHWRLIVLCAGAGLSLALLLGVTTEPIYRTRTSLDIRALNSNFMDMQSVAPTGNGSVDEVNTNLLTQIKLLESDTLLDAVTQHLMESSHPSAIPSRDLLSRARRGLHFGGQAGISYEALVQDAAKRVKVKPLGLTRLVEVTCDSYDPQFSALFCNTLTQTFEEQDLLARGQEAQKTQEWLTKQVADVRDRAEQSRKQLEQAVGGNGLMLSQTTTSAGEERMRSLQDELTKAQADRMQKEAEGDVARSATAATLAGVQDNPTHRAFEARLAELRGQLAPLLGVYTEQNPKIIKLRAEIADTESGLRQSELNSTTRESNDLSSARHREDLLGVAFKAQQAAVSSDLQKAQQVSLLKKELDSEEQLYQTMLQRAKEAGFASALQAATIRVIDTAKVPKVAASPRRTLLASVGLALGAIIGILVALFRDRNSKVFRLPGDVERYLHVHELGVIPAAHLAAPGTQVLARRAPPAISTFGEAIALSRWTEDFSISAEAYRNTTVSILLADRSKRARSYVISSPNVGEGKTTVVSNIGVALNKSRLRVVLIDGDLRRPNLHNAFALKNEHGLRDILRGQVDIAKTPTDALTQKTSLPNVSLITAGRGDEDIVELLHSSYFAALLARLSLDFDVILIDSPPVLHMADARILAGYSDGSILVFRAGLTTREQAGTARDLLARDGIRLVGTILNDFDPVAEGNPAYYSSYYRYGSSQAVAEEVGARA